MSNEEIALKVAQDAGMLSTPEDVRRLVLVALKMKEEEK